MLLAGTMAAVQTSSLPPDAFFGGHRLAQKAVALRAYERGGPVEAFVVGPSFVDQGVDAGALGQAAGLRAFNLGVQGTDMYFQARLLERLLDGGRRPKVVLWGLRDETLSRSNINRQYLDAPLFADGGLEARLGLEAGFVFPQYRRRGAREWLDVLARAEPEPLDAQGLLQLAGRTRLERRAALREGRDLPRGVADLSARRGAGEGGQEDGDAEPDEGEERGGFLGADYAVPLEPARAAIEATIARLRAGGAAVWLFLTPYSQQVFGRATGYSHELLTGQQAEYQAWVRALAARHDLQLVDLRYWAELSTSPEVFFDSRHLNGLGATPLGRLLGELVSGRRPVPEASRGFPAQAQLDAILGAVDPGAVPHLAVGERHALASAHLARQGEKVVSLRADVEVRVPGRYRAVVLDAAPRAHPGTFFARLGAGPYALVEGAEEPAPGRALVEAELEAGRQRFELHVRSGGALDWDAWTIVPARP